MTELELAELDAVERARVRTSRAPLAWADLVVLGHDILSVNLSLHELLQTIERVDAAEQNLAILAALRVKLELTREHLDRLECEAERSLSLIA